MTRPNNGTSKPSKGRSNTRKRSLSTSASSASSSNSSSPHLFSAASDSSGSSTDTARSSQKRRQTTSDEDLSPQPLVNSIPQRLFVQRNVPAFLNKLYSMVNDASTNSLIHWSKDGNSFIVEGHEEFAKQVLPRFYKHNTFASFVRQLNMYDFHKVPHLQQGVLISDSKHEIWEFSNPNFQRGRPEMLVLVTRKRNRERDDDEVSLSSIVKDIATIRKHQTSISNELHSIQRDNAVLWEETLTAREKHQRHQEVIAKILQFLTAVFTNERTPLGLSKHNISSRERMEHGSLLQGNDHDATLNPVAASVPNMPRQLIKEAASLAGMEIPDDTPTQDMSAGPSMSSGGEASSSSNSSVDSPTPDPSLASATAQQAGAANYAHPMQYAMPAMNEYPSSASLTDIGSITSCSQTIDSATRSVQAIAQDIDDLQMNVEALAGDLGINPSQLAGDFVSNGFHDQFADEYSRLIASATHQDRKMLFELANNRVYEAMNKPAYLQLRNSNGQQSQHQQLSNNTIAARRASAASARPRVPSPVLRSSMESSFCTTPTTAAIPQSPPQPQPQLLPVPVPVPVAMMPNQRQEYPTISDEYMALLTAQAQQTYADMTAAAAAAAEAGRDDKQSKDATKPTKD
ncbi:hypothetical protein BJV82DRAFT_39936 [Fennellomyces sp. T-0311]|nr:hypothetical protein BJV82DRAFT_39936 [Fennellomyces sp. T-0311]